MGPTKKANKQLKRMLFSRLLNPVYTPGNGQPTVWGRPDEIHADLYERSVNARKARKLREITPIKATMDKNEFLEGLRDRITGIKIKGRRQRLGGDHSLFKLSSRPDDASADKFEDIWAKKMGFFDPVTGNKYSRAEAAEYIYKTPAFQSAFERLDSSNKRILPAVETLKLNRRRFRRGPTILGLLAAAGLPTLLSQVRSNS